MLRLAFGTLRTRRAGFLGAFIAVVLGVTLTTLFGTLFESALRSKIPTERLAGANVVVQAHPDVRSVKGDNAESYVTPEEPLIPASLAGTLATLPGVKAAIPDRSFPVSTSHESGLGHGWSSAALTPFHLTAGTAPTSDSDVVLSAADGAKPGDTVAMTTSAGVKQFTVTGVADAPNQSQNAYFFTDAEATTLSGTGNRVPLIGLLATDGTSAATLKAEVTEALPSASALGVATGSGMDVLTGHGIGVSEFHDDVVTREMAIAIFAAIGGIGVEISIFVIAGAFGLSVMQRHREIALLRLVGTKPRQVRRMIAAEALLVAIAAAGFGGLFGAILAHPIAGAFGHLSLVPRGFRVWNSMIPPLVGLGAALLVTQVAGFVAGSRAARIKPADALRESRVERRPMTVLRWFLGLAALGGGVALTIVSYSLGGDQGASASPALIMLLMLAAAFLGPVLLRPLLFFVVKPIAKLAGTPGQLAHASLRTGLRRAAAAATPVMLVTAFGAFLMMITATQEHMAASETKARTVAEYVITPSHGAGIPRSVEQQVSQVPGVDQASATLPITVLTGDGSDNYPAQGIDPATLPAVMNVGATEGSIAALSSNPQGVAVSDLYAGSHNDHVGSTITVRMPDGAPEQVRIVAIYNRSLGLADFLFPRALVEPHTMNRYDGAVYVKLAPGADATKVGNELHQIVASVPGIGVTDRAGYLGAADADMKTNEHVQYVMLGVFLTFAAVSMANTLAMAAAERKQEFALLRLLGCKRKQIRSIVRWEIAFVLGFGALVGFVIATVTGMAFGHALAGATSPVIPLWLTLSVLGGAALLGTISSVVPSRLALRSNPLDAAY